MKKVFSILLVLVMLLAAAVPAAAEGKKYNDSIELFSDTLNGWFYATGTLPEGVTPVECAEQIRLYKTSWWGGIPEGMDTEQYANAAEVQFVKGDEALKDALTITEETGKVWTGGEQKEQQIFSLAVNNDAMATPGTATFRLKAESENFILEKDIELRVLSWEEDPLVIIREEPEDMTLKVGDKFDPDTVEDAVLEEKCFRKIEDKLGVNLRSTGRKSLNCTNVDDTILTYDSSVYDGYKVVGGGTWEAEYSLEYNNVRYTTTVQMKALKYWLTGDTMLKPGETGTYTIHDMEAESGRTFTLALEGEGKGITLDAEAGTLTAAEDVESAAVKVVATPSDGGEPVYVKVLIGSGVLAGIEMETEYEGYGFSVPHPAEGSGYEEGYYYTGQRVWYTPDESLPYQMTLDYSFMSNQEFYEDAEAALDYYEQNMQLDYEGLTVLANEVFEVEEGHPALMIICWVKGDYGDFCRGVLLYIRNNYCIRARLTTNQMNGGTPREEMPEIEKDDMIRIGKMITYDAEKAPITVQDAEITLTTKEGTNAVTAGKKLTFQAAFANPERVNKKSKNDTIKWSVTDPETGAAPEGISINAKGVLTTAKSDAVAKVEVKAYSPTFHVSAVYPVTVIPAVKSITLEPAEIYFYTGTDATAEVKASLDPETVPPIGITWTPAKAGIIEIIPDEENGIATIKPLAGGKTAVAVKEPGGKNAKLTVSVVDPVEDMTLEVKGKAVPGGTVTVKETISPKQAGNKNVEWTLDVDESIATIAKGKIKIAKTAPAGTIITVTCTAPGAPEPIVRTVEIEVIEK